MQNLNVLSNIMSGIPTPMIIFIVVVLLAIILMIILSGNGRNLNSMRRNTVGDGQFGTQRPATKSEMKKEFVRIKYLPGKWRKGLELPTVEGYIVSFEWVGLTRYALIDTSDSHVFNCAGPAGGKTKTLLFAQMEYALACGMSFINTDSKGDVLRMFGTIAKKYYGYENWVLNFKSPMRSQSINLNQLINKYMDIYKATGDLSAKARAEGYAQRLSSTIVNSDNFSGGQNAFFYEAAEGVITAASLLVAEYLSGDQRNIVSVFKIISELMAKGTSPQGAESEKEKKMYTKFQELMDNLPEGHKAKWFAGAVANSTGGSNSPFFSVMQTAMSRLLSFINSEMEQILCFDSELDMEHICENKVAVFIVFPEADKTKHKLVSIVLSQLYNESLQYVENYCENNRLQRRLYFYEDEFGLFPKQENVDGMFAASRGYNIMIVIFIQALSQLQEKYGANGTKTIMSCCQIVFGGGFAPLSDDAKVFVENLGSQTVATGSISTGSSTGFWGNTGSVNRSMTKRELYTADELKQLPYGKWLCVKKSFRPFIANMPFFKSIGILEDEPFLMPERTIMKINYPSADKLLKIINPDSAHYDTPNTGIESSSTIDPASYY